MSASTKDITHNEKMKYDIGLFKRTLSILYTTGISLTNLTLVGPNKLLAYQTWLGRIN